MPEYLAPGVYVEEIDTGSKPIEGVSTSTAGMLGVAERGPVDVPILVTSFGEYQRWFGQLLRLSEFSNNNGHDPHCFLPYAVDAFFRNGGKRVYVVRVLDKEKAVNAENFLFDRGAATAATRLLGNVVGGGGDIYILSGGGLAVPNWLQIGSGAEVEYRQIQALPATANDVSVRLPLTRPHAAATPVHHLNPAPAANGAPLNLTADVQPGATRLAVNTVAALNPAGGELLRIGTIADNDDEYIFTAGTTAATNTITLRTPLVLPHAAAAGAVQLMDSGTDVDATTLTASGATASGDTVLFLQNRTNYTTANDFLRITDANTDNVEIRRIGELGTLPLSVKPYADYPRGALIEVVTPTDEVGSADKSLTADAAAGSNVLDLDDRTGLNEGDVVRVGTSVDPGREFVVIKSLPNRLPAPDAGKVILAAPLQNARPKPSQVRKQTMPVPRAAKSPGALTLVAQRNAGELVTGGSDGFAVSDVVRVRVNAEIYYHRINAAPVALTPVPVTLDKPLTLPHTGGANVAAREPLFRVRALDAGAWGNRLRVSAQDHNPPLLKTKIRAIDDATHIRLDSANNVETGTILQLADAKGEPISTPFKVVAVDRQNDYLLTLDAANPLPAAVVGDAVRSREFQLNVYLLRQPDPAVPTRNEAALDSESFRHLSMDHRHSRYFQKVIGTTWTVAGGVTDDDEGQPLRRADRRAEGESAYIRVRDQATTVAAREAMRFGPELLLDKLPNGTERPTRRPLTGGDDSVLNLTDATYIGTDDPEPVERTGLFSLQNEDEISIVACPGRTSAKMQEALINHCELMRYRFAVLDGPQPPGDSLSDVQTQRQQYDTKYAALYHPWVLIPDPYPVNLVRIPDFPLPPSGHIVGVYARTDVERGVHKAPANEVVRGITGLQRILNKGEQDILNPYPVNINVIRDFRTNNRGIRVYGGRVITSDPDWKYVNVRRLLIFIENSIDRGLQWVVFEPNAEPLWARVRRSISNFLTQVWRDGALEGTKVEEAYFVKCDRTTMTQTDIDNGRLICVVGVAPVKPAEFVIIRIGLWTAHADN